MPDLIEVRWIKKNCIYLGFCGMLGVIIHLYYKVLSNQFCSIWFSSSRKYGSINFSIIYATSLGWYQKVSRLSLLFVICPPSGALKPGSRIWYLTNSLCTVPLMSRKTISMHLIELQTYLTFFSHGNYECQFWSWRFPCEDGCFVLRSYISSWQTSMQCAFCSWISNLGTNWAPKRHTFQSHMRIALIHTYDQHWQQCCGLLSDDHYAQVVEHFNIFGRWACWRSSRDVLLFDVLCKEGAS